MSLRCYDENWANRRASMSAMRAAYALSPASSASAALGGGRCCGGARSGGTGGAAARAAAGGGGALLLPSRRSSEDDAPAAPSADGATAGEDEASHSRLAKSLACAMLKRASSDGVTAPSDA